MVKLLSFAHDKAGHALVHSIGTFIVILDPAKSYLRLDRRTLLTDFFRSIDILVDDFLAQLEAKLEKSILILEKIALDNNSDRNDTETNRSQAPTRIQVAS